MYKVVNNDIEMIRGDTATFTINITGKDASTYSVDSSDTFTFTVKRSAQSPTVLIEKKFTGIVGGSQVTLTLDPADTSPVPFGTYVYDIQLKNTVTGYTDTIISPHKFRLGEEVTWS